MRKKTAFFCLFATLVCVLAGTGPTLAASSSGLQYTQVNNQRYVFLDDVARFYNLSYSERSDTAELSSQWSRLRFRSKKRKAEFNDVTFHLAFAPADRKHRVAVSADDFRYHIDPILRPSRIEGRVNRIVIDPGHGGDDEGAQTDNMLEKDLVLDISQRVNAYLKGVGYQVILTRNSDRDISLKQRSRKANRAGADLFISIHGNAVENASVHGIESFILPPSDTPGTYTHDPMNRTYPGHNHSTANTALAYALQKQLLHTTNAHDRGVKHANLSVLREARTPAALVEIGFLTNPEEANRLATSSYRNKIAQGIANGVRYYHRLITGTKNE